MPITVSQTYTAVVPQKTVSFAAAGGVEPYLFEVVPGGAGGSINMTTGVYTAPNVASSDVLKSYETIRVTDYNSEEATAQVMVGTPLLLFCEILQRVLGLAPGRVYLWDQKILQPTDQGLFIAVSVPSCRPFGNINRPESVVGGLEQTQFVSMLAKLDIDIISRGPAARDRKEEVILALNSNYAQRQQEANGFSIGKLPSIGGFTNISMVDGTAIPYRYKISVNMQYAYAMTTPIDYFDTFENVEVITDP